MTVSEIKVESTSTPAGKVKEMGGGIEFERTDDVGKLDANIQIGGGTPPKSLDTEARISGGNSGLFELGQFRDGGSLVDMSDQDVTILIIFGDGTEERYKFTP